MRRQDKGSATEGEIVTIGFSRKDPDRGHPNGTRQHKPDRNRIEIGTRFVADYELKVFAKVLNVAIDWLLEE